MFFSTQVQIPHNNVAVEILIPIVKNLGLASGILVIGLLFTISFLIEEQHGSLTAEGLRVRTLLRFASMVWFVCVVGNVVLELANLLAVSIGDALDPTTMKSFLLQTGIGHSYLIQLVVGALLVGLVGKIMKTGGSNLFLSATLFAFVIPIFQSHSSSSGNHGMAIGSLFFHVLAISLWVGGLMGLLVIAPSERAQSLPRFSSMALWCSVIVAVSGVANAWTRLNFLAGWNSLYGVLVILKVVLMAILIGFGYRYRTRYSTKARDSVSVFQLISAEAFVMVITVVIGGWLSVSAPPVRKAAEIAGLDPVLNLTGLAMPAAPNISRLLWTYIPDGTFLGFLVLATALYIRGVVVLSRRGDKWPVGRTVAFILGVASADYATSGGIGVYSHFSFSLHMIGHMILGMMSPIGFVLSAPITLALRTLPIGRTSNERGVRATFLVFLHSRYARTITNPLVALTIFDGSLFLLYMTPLFGTLMQSHSGHLIMNIHFILSGFLFFHVIVGVDPNPQKVPHLVRVIMLFGAMSVHAFFSIALLSSSTLIDGGYFASLNRPWATDLLVDQHTGGAIGWAMGEIPILIALIATFIQWTRDDSREAKRIDRASDRALAMGEDDELAKYNKLLLNLASHDQKFPDN